MRCLGLVNSPTLGHQYLLPALHETQIPTQFGDGCRVPCVPKSTFGTFFASSGASKYCWGWKPNARA